MQAGRSNLPSWPALAVRRVETFRVRQENALACFSAKVNGLPLVLRLRMEGRVAVDGAMADGFNTPCRNRDYHAGQCLFTGIRGGVWLRAFFSSGIHCSKGLASITGGFIGVIITFAGRVMSWDANNRFGTKGSKIIPCFENDPGSLD